jgi:Ca2+-binding RTX toxin-like protein
VLRIEDSSNTATHVYRKGEEIVVFSNVEREPTACAGGTPTVFNVDRIEYSTTNSSPFFDYIGGGPLAPGATPEASGSEIEVLVQEEYEPGVLNVSGTRGGDSIVAGQLGPHQVGVNTNAQEDGAAQDADFILSTADPGEAFVRIVGKAGNDRVSDLGGAGFTGPLTTDHVSFAGGEGDDTLVGGPHRERLRGDAGNDVLLAGAGNDTVTIGAGHDLAKGGKGDDRIDNIGDVGGAPLDTGSDRIFAGPGNDVVESVQIPQQLGGDFVNCGSGRRDDAEVDPGDRTRACEKVEVRHLPPE